MDDKKEENENFFQFYKMFDEMGEISGMDEFDECYLDDTNKVSDDIEYYDNIKIVDKYTFNSFNSFNENELNELKNILCLREINEPLLLSNRDTISKILRIEKDKDVLEKIFLIYELYDDFEPSNNGTLLDLLNDTIFTISIGGSTIISINLGMDSFICDETGEDILYITISDLKEQIKNCEFNHHKHKYRDLVEHLLENNKFGNKILIIPICLNIFVNNIPLKLFKYHDFDFILCDYTKNNKFINNIYISTQTINFVNKKTIDSPPKFNLNILQMTNVKYNINSGRDMSNYTSDDLLFVSKNYKYFTIKLSPNYKEIDKNIWDDAINILPNINTISYIDDNTGNIQTFTPFEISLIRKSNNCYIYAFSTNPNISIKNFIANSVKENGDGLEVIYKGLYVLKNKDETHSIFKKYNSRLNSEKINLRIVLNIDTPRIPINIVINTYKKNNLIFSRGMAGAHFSY